MFGGDAEQDAGGTGRLAVALFPVAQRGGADAKGGRELRLAEVEFGPDGGRLLECEPALYRVLNLGEGRGVDHAEAAHQMSGRDSRNALGVEAARIEPARGVRHLKACASQSRRAGNEGDDGALDLLLRHAQKQGRPGFGDHPEVNQPNFATMETAHTLFPSSSS